MKWLRIQYLPLPRPLLVLLLLGSRFLAVAQQAEASLKMAYDTHQWFQLRNELRASKEPLPLYRGAVAAAFNQKDSAEHLLRPLTASQPTSDTGSESRQWLTYLYFRSGQYREALALIDEELKAKPGSGAQGFRILLSGFNQNQSAGHVAPSRVRYRLDRDLNLFIPVLINGHSGEYVMDSDANISMIAESEAKRLGLSVRSLGDSAIKMSGAAGQGVAKYRVTVADDLAVGDVHLRNVAFLVLPDTTKPFGDLLEGRRAILGIPVLLGFQAMRWNNQGVFEIAFDETKDSRDPEPSLCLDGSDPIAPGEYNGQPIQLLLDTGSIHTDFWSKFAQKLPVSVKNSATPSKWQLKGVDGTTEVDSLSLKQLEFSIGHYSAVLSPAHVLLDEPSTNDWYDARLGMDALSKARQVTIDFRIMSLTVE